MFYIIYNMIILNLICPGIRVSVPLFYPKKKITNCITKIHNIAIKQKTK